MASRNSGTYIVKGWTADLAASLGFLTRLPMPAELPLVPLSEAMRAFPLAGALIGGLAGLVLAALAGMGLPALAAAGLTLAALAFLTGALHEDGLADTADGLGGGRDRDGKLAIMRDSHIGTYGVLTLVIGVLVKAACLAALAQAHWLHLVALLAASGALSRALIVWLMASTPPARSDGVAHGAGQPSDFTARSALLAGGILALALILITQGLIPALVVTGAGAMAAGAVRFLAMRQIGGHTGDICGALQVASETAMLAAAAATLS
jgi:adenosylcobinamide-GDP ribazoletransferase